MRGKKDGPLVRRRRTSPANGQGWPTMERRKTILICDDEPALRELIRASMDDGFEFAEASDGIVAMELAKELSPDMVILDLMLPRLSGLEVLARLNADQQLKDVPVLVITAWNETREDVLAAGADDFVSKPFDPEALRSAVNRLVAA
jgi:DNA-binding response OmpR family regulator